MANRVWYLPAMPKRSSNGKDVNRMAYGIAAAVTSGKNPAAVALGRLGGKKGGDARAKALSPERRREIAVKAARARWEQMPEAVALEKFFENHLSQFSPEQQQEIISKVRAIPVRDRKRDKSPSPPQTPASLRKG